MYYIKAGESCIMSFLGGMHNETSKVKAEVEEDADFHFLITNEQISKYMEIARKSVNRFMTIETFSENGPTKCSGLDIKQYTKQTLIYELKNGFEKIRCVTEDHITPFNTTQNFLFCSFKRQKK